MFHQWEEQREAIEKELGLSRPLSRQPIAEKSASRIRVFRPFKVENDKWEYGFKWLLETGARMKRMFSKNWQA